MTEPDASDHRWPRWVYGVGDEPDPRFSLANERTFLAWIRTSLALLASGVALEALQLPAVHALRLVAAALLIGLAVLGPVQAWVGWMRVERAMRRQQPLPAPVLIGPIGVVVAVAALLVLAGVVVG